MLLLPYKIFFICVLAINFLTFLLFGIDKWRAVHSKRRISEFALLLFCFLGGSFGALMGMYLFRHKTKKRKFKVVVPLLFIFQLALLIAAAFLLPPGHLIK